MAEIKGADELVKRLKGISDELLRKSGRAALRRAANLIRDKARDNAGRLDDNLTPESIEKNISVRWSARTFKATGDMKFRIGVLGGAQAYANTKENVRKGRAGKMYATQGSKTNPGGDTFYWRFLELGTKSIGPRPFLRDAATSTADAAINTFADALNKALDRAAKKGLT